MTSTVRTGIVHVLSMLDAAVGDAWDDIEEVVASTNSKPVRVLFTEREAKLCRYAVRKALEMK